MTSTRIADPFDDPTTAVQAIHRLHDCLRELSGRRLTSGEWRDSRRCPPLERQRELLEEAVGNAYDDPRVAAAARIPDVQGIGSGADVAAAPGAVEKVAPPL